jgi:hypothetical protein
MSEHDEWHEFEDEDAIVLEALAQMRAHDGDDELDEALREAFAAVAQEALALMERRMQREAAFAWADEQAQIAVEHRHARKDAERRDKAHREAEEAGRQRTRERARRDEARREAEQRRHREGQPPDGCRPHRMAEASRAQPAGRSAAPRGRPGHHLQGRARRREAAGASAAAGADERGLNQVEYSVYSSE